MLSEKLFKALKNKKKDLSDNEKQAKMDVVKDLRDAAMDSMKQKLDGVKKVSVLSDSDEGLEAGLDKAKELVSGEEAEKDAEIESMKPHMEPEETHEAAPEENELEEMEGLDYQALMEKIQKLQELANKMKK